MVGFATWPETAGATEREDLFVDPGYRRRGIATALVSPGTSRYCRRAPIMGTGVLSRQVTDVVQGCC